MKVRIPILELQSILKQMISLRIYFPMVNYKIFKMAKSFDIPGRGGGREGVLATPPPPI